MRKLFDVICLVLFIIFSLSIVDLVVSQEDELKDYNEALGINEDVVKDYDINVKK